MTQVFPEVSHIVHFPHSAKEIYEQESCYYLQVAKCVCHRDVAMILKTWKCCSYRQVLAKKRVSKSSILLTLGLNLHP